jgi:hypothetical protein
MPISPQKPPEMFDYSSHRDRGYRDGVVKFLTDMGLFKGQQNPAFFALLNRLAADADAAEREDENGD